MPRPRVSAAVLPLALLAVPGPATAATGAETGADEARAALRARAAASYESGDCASVLAAFAELEAGGGTADGVEEYRRGYCLARTRSAGAEEAYGRAVALLGPAAAGGPGVPLDVHFYRVNALVNLGRSADAREAAAFAVARWKAGELVVAQERPDEWFRLGKLHRDAGDNDGALEPFRRALDAADGTGTALRSAYLQRISRAAREAGDSELATRAAEMDAASGSAGPGARLGAGRALVTKGDLDGAHAAFTGLRKLGGDLGMKAQYAAMAVDRARELAAWDLRPVTALPDGRTVASLELGELQGELFSIARDAAALIAEGEYRPRTRKLDGAIVYWPTDDVRAQLRDRQARLAGLLLEAVQRDAPLREWAVSGGFANMVHRSLPVLFRRQALIRAEEAGESPVAGD